MTTKRMYLSLWLSIVLAGGQSGCNSLQTTNPTPPQVFAQAPAASVAPATKPRNPDMYQIPKTAPAGTKMSYSSVAVNGPYIALTFDDGPHPVHTPRLLNYLAQRNVKATFYVLGNNSQRYPAIIRRILAEGHELGNHTWDHPALSKIPAASVYNQLSQTDKTIREITGGYRMRTMRPPYGATNDRVKEQIYRQFGYPSIMWSVDPEDWKKPGVSVVANRLIQGARHGGILLVHDIHPSTIDAMPQTLDGLLAKGYKFVTVSQLLNLEVRPPLAAASAPAAPASPAAF